MDDDIQYDRLWQHLTDRFLLRHNLLHGPAHWRQVERNGLEICGASDADLVVVRLFAVLHDSQRHNDGYDPEHGARAADVAMSLQDDFFVITDQQMETLCEALTWHNHGQTSPDVTIGTCWDADRMDLPRVGLIPDAELMSTDYGQQWARAYQQQRYR